MSETKQPPRDGEPDYRHFAELIVDNAEGGAQLEIKDEVLRESMIINAEKQLARIYRLGLSHQRPQPKASTALTDLANTRWGLDLVSLRIGANEMRRSARQFENPIKEGSANWAIATLAENLIGVLDFVEAKSTQDAIQATPVQPNVEDAEVAEGSPEFLNAALCGLLEGLAARSNKNDAATCLAAAAHITSVASCVEVLEKALVVAYTYAIGLSIKDIHLIDDALHPTARPEMEDTKP